MSLEEQPAKRRPGKFTGTSAHRSHGLRLQYELFSSRYITNILKGMDLSDASVDAYINTVRTEGAKSVNRRTLLGMANRLLHCEYVDGRIKELVAHNLQSVGASREWVMSQLKGIAEIDPESSARLTALKLLCEVGGYFAPKNSGPSSSSTNQTTITMEMLVAESYKHQLAQPRPPMLIENEKSRVENDEAR